MAPIGKDKVIAILVRAFSPYVGPTMAGASVRGVCERFAVGDVMDRARIDAVIGALEPGLHVYVGKDKTQAAIREIRAAIDALGGSS